MKKQLLFLFISMSSVSAIYAESYFTIVDLSERNSTIYQDMETLHAHNAFNKENIDIILKKHNVSDVDELLYFLNRDKAQLNTHINSLKTTRFLQAFVMGGIGILSGIYALNLFLNPTGHLKQQFPEEIAKMNLSSDSTISQEILTKKYRTLSLKFHPDKNKGNEETTNQQFIEMKNAYDKLGEYLLNIPLYKKILSTLSSTFLGSLPFILHANKKNLTQATTTLKNLDEIILSLEEIQQEEENI